MSVLENNQLFAIFKKALYYITDFRRTTYTIHKF